jgi:hypothetical protein
MQWQADERKKDSRWTQKNDDWESENANKINKPEHTHISGESWSKVGSYGNSILLNPLPKSHQNVKAF